MDQKATAAPSRRALRLAGTIALSTSVSLLVVLSSWMSETRLGAPLYWAWVLTGLQVIALWAAGRRQWWAWLLGAGVQPVWIVYAVLTGQFGFVPGCVISAAVQLRNFLRDPDPVINTDHAARRSRAHRSGRPPRSCLALSQPSRQCASALLPEEQGRAYGLACDNLVAAEVVTATGARSSEDVAPTRRGCERDLPSDQ